MGGPPPAKQPLMSVPMAVPIAVWMIQLRTNMLRHSSDTMFSLCLDLAPVPCGFSLSNKQAIGSSHYTQRDNRNACKKQPLKDIRAMRAQLSRQTQRRCLCDAAHKKDAYAHVL